MADILYEGGNNIGTFSDNAAPGAPSGYTGGSPVDTGDLRRKYNFGDRISELAISQDPFFRFVASVAKKPTDDPEFKFTERRDSWSKRYAYALTGGAAYDTALTNDIALSVAGSSIKLRFGTDYASEGNKSNVYGKTLSYKPGATGTKPVFFLEDQLIKVPVAAAANDGADQAVADYLVVKVTNVTDNGNVVDIDGVVVKGVEDEGFYLMGLHASLDSANDITASEESLAPYKCYVVGSVFGKGTGYPESWMDQPFSSSYGQTQIWKTSMAMTNTDRATSLKYEGNEWARIWKEKLIEHKWDIEQSLLFGAQNATYRTTQGAVDWILNHGNAFNLNTTTKTQDDFLDDLSALMDPRYNGTMATVFFCSTAVYNWLHKLSGYFANNLGQVQPYVDGATQTPTGGLNSLASADLAVTGRKKVLGLDSTNISCVYGDMNVVRNIHLDGTNIAMLGVNMKNCSYRPLVGNGINRDTSVYVGVQTLENSGVDRRVDQIITEAGMEWSLPETHAVWKNA